MADFSDRDRKRIIKSTKKSERETPTFNHRPLSTNIATGELKFAQLDAELAYDDEPGDAHLRFRVGGAWKDDARTIKVDPCWYPVGKKLPDGAEVLIVKSGDAYIVVAARECFEDV